MSKPFPDVETVLLDWLEITFPRLTTTDVRHVDTRTPAEMPDLFVRVALLTGRDDSVTDRSVVDIDVFAADRATAYAMSEDIRTELSGRPHRVGTVVLDRVGTEEKPRLLPWADDNIVRYGATYTISARR